MLTKPKEGCTSRIAVRRPGETERGVELIDPWRASRRAVEDPLETLVEFDEQVGVEWMLGKSGSGPSP